MSKSPAQKIAYAQRRETRLLRAKVATAFAVGLMARSSLRDEQLVNRAVVLADLLLAEVDRTEPKAGGGES